MAGRPSPLTSRLIYIKRGKVGEGFKTKLELAKELIQKALARNLPFSCMVFDEWYFNHDMTSFIERLGKGKGGSTHPCRPTKGTRGSVEPKWGK